MNYKDAGVDIDAGEALVQAIKPLAKATSRRGADALLGGFGAFFDLKAAGFRDPLLVATTDGVGTKLKLAIDAKKHDTVGIDLVAMCVNDLVVQGADPLFFLDYYATGKLTLEVGREIIKGIAEGCKQAGSALVGGETAEMPGMYKDGDYDLAGFAVGAVERDAVLTGQTIQAGDIILGLASSGVHSNGFSLVRKIVARSGLSWQDPSPFGPGKLGEALLAPTRIYVKSCLAAHATGKLKGLAHITGGGLCENIPRIMPKGLKAVIDASSWQALPVFKWLQKVGNVEALEMARVFNCGIGMMAVCAPSDVEALSQVFSKNGETAYKIGQVIAGENGSAVIEKADALWNA